MADTTVAVIGAARAGGAVDHDDDLGAGRALPGEATGSQDEQEQGRGE